MIMWLWLAVGMLIGVLFSSAIQWIQLRCEFGWHVWQLWLISSDGCSQYRICSRCRLYEPRFIVDKTTGNTVKVTFPKPSEANEKVSHEPEPERTS